MGVHSMNQEIYNSAVQLFGTDDQLHIGRADFARSASPGPLSMRPHSGTQSGAMGCRRCPGDGWPTVAVRPPASVGTFNMPRH